MGKEIDGAMWYNSDTAMVASVRHNFCIVVVSVMNMWTMLHRAVRSFGSYAFLRDTRWKETWVFMCSIDDITFCTQVAKR